jgi:outer membrane protein OmpA-like peptidoglycan-associated protein
MKKIIYTIAVVLVSGIGAHAQTPVKQTKDELADFILLENDLIVFTRKEEKGQFIYTEQRGQSKSAKKELVLNAGAVNAVIGRNKASNELYVYHKNGRKDEIISFYTLKDGSFSKTGERILPKMRNHSHNFGLFLSEDKNTLLISAELSNSNGYDDVYLSKWENNNWSKPLNLGKTVNSKDAEFSPFVANDSLYFSRKGSEGTYAYVVPFREGKLSGEPVKLKTVVNKSSAYNAYYKTMDERQMWLTASAGKPGYTAYVIEKLAPVENKVVVPVEDEVAKPVVKTRSTTPEFVLFYKIDHAEIPSKDASALTEFLKKQPDGTSLVVKGYSDGFGTPQVKELISRKRAQKVKKYIEQQFSGKNFELILEYDVLESKGHSSRKTEFYLIK